MVDLDSSPPDNTDMPQQWVIQKIKESSGWISLENYMDLCLNDPKHGYYSTRISQIGNRGDFSTTTTLSPVLAKAILDRYRQAVKKYGSFLSIIEVGAGDGSLSAHIRKELGFRNRRKTPYFIVDTSPPLRELQKKRLGSFICHADTMKDALQKCGGKAFIFSNELPDAFPARILQKTDQGWDEIGLYVYANRLLEKKRPVSQDKLPDSSALSYYKKTGQRIEVHASFRKWCLSWAPYWDSGEMITIDYGAPVEDLYYRQPWGTFRGYKNHRRLTGEQLYLYPGKTDLTCDVNFTDLQLWGHELGWETTELMYQRDFLLPFSDNSSADQFLNHPNGAGTAFCVLVQSPVPA